MKALPAYYVNCHQLIEQLKKAHFENRLPDKLKVLAKYRMLIIDEIGYLPIREYLPNVQSTDLEGNGTIYYMNGRNGTEFDWYVNEHISSSQSYISLWQNITGGKRRFLQIPRKNIEDLPAKEEYEFTVCVHKGTDGADA